MFKRIDHIEITTGNLEKTLPFYMNVLGFKIKQRNKMDRPPLEEIIYLTLGDTMIEVLSVKDPAPLATQPWQVGYRMMALEVENVDEALEYLKGKSVEISRMPSATGTSKRAEIKDPEGRSIELRQWG